MNNKDIKISFYSGNIRFTKCMGFVTLDRFINSIKNPKKNLSDIFDKIEEASALGKSALKRELKHKLYSFTPTALVGRSSKRSYKNLADLNPIMQIDLDKIPDKDIAISLKHYIFENDDRIICAFLSPSRLGVKALMRIKKPRDVEHYKAIHKAVSKEYEQYGYFDEATNNAILPMFLSRDYDILYRDFSECSEFTDEDWSKPEYVNLVSNQPQLQIQNLDYYTKKVVTILEKRINSIVDNGHPQVRTAALILGSRISAGYIDKIDAENLITNLIISNSYLSKGVKGYLDTAKWGINQGLKNPKYFK